MTDFLNNVLAGLVASALLLVLGRLARAVRSRLPKTTPRRAVLLRAVYLGRFLDFYLGNARTELLATCTFAILLNLLGANVLHKSQGLLFLDTAGTALAAFVLGPWWGATVGLVTNVIGSVLLGRASHYHTFAVVNALLGVVWGYYALCRRQDMTRIDFQLNWSAIRSLLVIGGLGVITSSLSACYTLLFILDLNPNVPNTFNYALHEFLQEKLGVAKLSFWPFFASEIVFNLPDKVLSVAIAVALMRVVFPVARLFDDLPGTINFIKSSAGSHLVFAGFYLIYVVFLKDPEMPLWFALVPLVLCIISYVGMAAFVPVDLKNYIVLAQYFGERIMSADTMTARRRALQLAFTTVLVVAIHFTVVALIGYWCGVWGYLPADVRWRENFGALLTALLFFFLAIPSLFFLAQDTRSTETGLRKQNLLSAEETFRGVNLQPPFGAE